MSTLSFNKLDPAIYTHPVDGNAATEILNCYPINQGAYKLIHRYVTGSNNDCVIYNRAFTSFPSTYSSNNYSESSADYSSTGANVQSRIYTMNADLTITETHAQLSRTRAAFKALCGFSKFVGFLNSNNSAVNNNYFMKTDTGVLYTKQISFTNIFIINYYPSYMYTISNGTFVMGGGYYSNDSGVTKIPCSKMFSFVDDGFSLIYLSATLVTYPNERVQFVNNSANINLGYYYNSTTNVIITHATDGWYTYNSNSQTGQLSVPTGYWIVGIYMGNYIVTNGTSYKRYSITGTAGALTGTFVDDLNGFTGKFLYNVGDM